MQTYRMPRTQSVPPRKQAELRTRSLSMATRGVGKGYAHPICGPMYIRDMHRPADARYHPESPLRACRDADDSDCMLPVAACSAEDGLPRVSVDVSWRTDVQTPSTSAQTSPVHTSPVRGADVSGKPKRRPSIAQLEQAGNKVGHLRSRCP